MAFYSLLRLVILETSGSGDAGCLIRTICVVALDNGDDSCWLNFFFPRKKIKRHKCARSLAAAIELETHTVGLLSSSSSPRYTSRYMTLNESLALSGPQFPYL